MKLVLTGKVPSKKNSRVTTSSGRSFPNKAYADWEKDALGQLLAQAPERVLNYPVSLVVKFYVPDMVGRDLDNMLSSVLDVIKDQKKRKAGKMVVVRYGVVEDDSWRHISPISMEAELDRENPRAEIWIDD